MKQYRAYGRKLENSLAQCEYAFEANIDVARNREGLGFMDRQRLSSINLESANFETYCQRYETLRPSFSGG